MGIFGFSQRETGTKSFCLVNETVHGHSVSFGMQISGLKLKEHCSNVAGDILVDTGFYCLSGTIYDIINFLICIMQNLAALQNLQLICLSAVNADVQRMAKGVES